MNLGKDLVASAIPLALALLSGSESDSFAGNALLTIASRVAGPIPSLSLGLWELARLLNP